MFNVWICQSSNFKAVGSPASNLHNLDLEADLQRQPVIFKKKYLNLYFVLLLFFNVHIFIYMLKHLKR